MDGVLASLLVLCKQKDTTGHAKLLISNISMSMVNISPKQRNMLSFVWRRKCSVNLNKQDFVLAGANGDHAPVSPHA